MSASLVVFLVTGVFAQVLGVTRSDAYENIYHVGPILFGRSQRYGR